MAADVLTGRLLVASPWLRDTNFARTVVLMLEHGEDGALGLVLNRPSPTPVADALPSWGDQAAEPSVLYLGGPVEVSSAIGLASVGDARPAPLDRSGPPGTGGGWRPLFGRLGTFDLTLSPNQIDVAIVQLRVFAGHSGWTGGQLEDEIGAGMWFVVESQPGDAMSARPATMWHDVLRRQPEPLASLAGFPVDLSLN